MPEYPQGMVFVRNRNKKSEYIMTLSTDSCLSEEEIDHRYGYRWTIESGFKVCKSLLKLGKEVQSVNYDTTVSSTVIVFTRYIILEWIHRKNSDYHSLGEIFFFCYDDGRDIELSDALERLLSIMADGLANGTITIGESVRIEIIGWYVFQPAFIQAICRDQMVSAGFIATEDHSSNDLSMVA